LLPTSTASTYRAPAWLPGRHAQTLYPFFLPRPDIAFRRERVETPDGDFWDVDWSIPGSNVAADAPLLVVFHGLEGDSRSNYARHLMLEADALGWRGVVPHFRGCGGEPNRLPRAYHSGDHEEIGHILAALQARIGVETPMVAVGISLGGSALLNWLGRAGPAARPLLAAAATASVPLDLMAAGLAIDTGFNRLYAWHFLHTLRPKALAMAARFPGRLDAARIAAARTMREFDDAVTAPLHGFADVADYWTRGSSKPWLRGVQVPTLVLNARNDPFVPGASLPSPADVSPWVRLEQPDTGGHAGFLHGNFPGSGVWLPRHLATFLAAARHDKREKLPVAAALPG
jgi:hypothetical protein